jgi:hypothetical protein
MTNHFHETHYIDYINTKLKNDLHPKITKSIADMPSELCNHIIFYGPSGIGKYSTSLMYIRNYSDTNLTYEKKMAINYNKETYCYKISDVHFEIDMETLGCNARLLWIEIISHIEDVVSSRQNKRGIILCRNFHAIHSELLETFYSYMQRNNKSQNIFFYIISESISFIPENINNCCLHINMSRPSTAQYNKCLNTKIKSNSNIENIKGIYNSGVINDKCELLSNSIYSKIINPKELKYTNFRDLLYDILIYDYNIGRLIFSILKTLFNQNSITIDSTKKNAIYGVVHTFLKNYNNNYRPIYHLELLMFNIIGIVHGL